jgi:hypothetical protein
MMRTVDAAMEAGRVVCEPVVMAYAMRALESEEDPDLRRALVALSLRLAREGIFAELELIAEAA